MKKVIQFNTKETIEVKNETISGFVLKIKALTSVPAVAVIADLSKISVDVILFRANQKSPIYFYQNYLHKLLAFMNGNNSLNAQFVSGETDEKFIKFNFGGSLQLLGGDRLEVRLSAQSTAFTSLATASSDISFETVPSVGASNQFNQYDVIPVGNSEITLDKDLKSGVSSIMYFSNLVTGSTDYQAHSNSKVDELDLVSDNFKKAVSSDVLWQENCEQQVVFGEAISGIYNLYLYRSQNLLNNVKLRGKLNTAANADASVLVTRRVSA